MLPGFCPTLEFGQVVLTPVFNFANSLGIIGSANYAVGRPVSAGPTNMTFAYNTYVTANAVVSNINSVYTATVTSVAGVPFTDVKTGVFSSNVGIANNSLWNGGSHPNWSNTCTIGPGDTIYAQMIAPVWGAGHNVIAVSIGSTTTNWLTNTASKGRLSDSGQTGTFSSGQENFLFEFLLSITQSSITDNAYALRDVYSPPGGTFNINNTVSQNAESIGDAFNVVLQPVHSGYSLGWIFYEGDACYFEMTGPT